MHGRIRHGAAAAFLALISCLAGGAAPGAELRDDIIGGNEYYQVRKGETLLEIARLHDLGFIELVSANPGMDPWIPAAGRTILLPSEHLLPDAPRRGIVINRPELRLYFFGDGTGAPITFPIGVGRQGRETPLGSTSIAAKRENPAWTPPPSIRAERPELPATVPPGPDNPLGLFAMNLGWRNYVIHGTNKPYGIGRRVSSGCIRLYPEDIEQLFDTVEIGTPVMIVDQAAKLGWLGGELYMEIHPTVAEGDELEEKGWYMPTPVPDLKERIREVAGRHEARIDWPAVARAERAKRGIPVRITR
jgi:L,D-transpeptidase ErfK/SrfK